MNEIQRMLRHGFAPVVAYFVAKGWLPETAAGDVVEFAVLFVSFAGPYAWSWWREKHA